MTTLKHSFRLSVDRARAWDLLTDLERVAACMPGASVEAVENGTYSGRVRVKLGGMRSEFRGKARFEERDDEAQRYKISAEGRESRGQGSARATVELSLSGSRGEPTEVSVVTSLDTAGRIAQFGRAMLQDVSEHLMREFVGELERQFGEPQDDMGSTGSRKNVYTRQKGAAQTSEPVATRSASEREDLMDIGRLVGEVTSRRLVPVGAGALGLIVGGCLGILLARRGRRRPWEVRLSIG
jgi:carbon monoxide dehydrogenase subunit G